MSHEEYLLQASICQYLTHKYPEVLFISDTVASLKMTPAQCNRNKKVQKEKFKCPDLLILEPKGVYCGLFLELKIATPFKKNGDIKASSKDHLKLQYESLEKLKQKGYFCSFSWGFEMTKNLIDDYLKK
jgi:hypothetical protein